MFITHGLFTSESVSEGHPDKLADRISDRILDAFLELDPKARVACETLLTDQYVVVAGEFKSARSGVFEAVQANAENLVRTVIRDTGYRDSATGIDPERCEVQIRFNHQSSDISQGVDRLDGILGAGDQGLMFGYACNETPELMPAALAYAHRLVQRQSELRKTGTLPWLQPDAKSQVTLRYADGRVVGIETVVLSTQHDAHIDLETLRAEVQAHIIDPVIPHALRSSTYRVLVNPTGRFVTGGPKGDAGLTGRKIVVDTYGGAAPHGGGAFSGKDPSKVDRSAAYMARFLAKQVVSRQWASKALVQLAYAIGVAEPVGFAVETFGTGQPDGAEIAALLSREFDLTPQGIIEQLDLLRPIYFPTAAYGHFGRTDLALPWEKTIAPDSSPKLNPPVASTLHVFGNYSTQAADSPGEPPPELVAAYESTVFCIYGSSPSELKIDSEPAHHSRWLKHLGRSSATVVTAWNPFSQARPLEVNQERQLALIAMVNQTGLTWCPAAGVDPSGRWPAEESICVFDADDANIDRWLEVFGQYAVVHAEVDGSCTLLWHPCCSNKPGAQIGGSGSVEENPFGSSENEEDFFEEILNRGKEVAFQDWDSGGPGIGAGRVSVLLFEGAFYVSHDAGLDGPFPSITQAISSGGIMDINESTVAIWVDGQGTTFQRRESRGHRESDSGKSP